MPRPHALMGLAAMALALGPAFALECASQKDHGTEYTTNGKIYKVYCNSEIKPATNLDPPQKVASPEACADLCAARAGNDCGHVMFNSGNKMCALRPKPTSIKEGSLAGSKFGDTYQLVYDRDVPPPPPPPTTGGGGTGTGGSGTGGTGTGGSGTGGSGTGGSGTGGSGTGGSGTGGSGTGGSGTGGSGWTGNLASYDCTGKRDHQKWYYINGEMYELLCDHGNPHTGVHTIPNVGSLAQCAELCSKDARCVTAEYHVSSKDCELEPDNNPTAAPGYHLWVPKTCPATPRPATAVANPAVTKDLTCPMSDGKIYEGADGTWYYVQCCTDAAKSLVKGVERTASHQACVDKCEATADCNSVSFDHKASGPNCKMYGLGEYSTAHAPGITHMYATNPPTVAPNLFDTRRCSTDCPDADGQIFASPTGENFIMSCKKRHGTSYLKATPDRYPTFAACMKACGATPACLSVDYETKTQNCYFSTNSKNPTIAAKAFMSAHSAGCAGACAGCNGTTCDDLNAGPLSAKDRYACPENHGEVVTVHAVDFRIACTLQLDSGPEKLVAAATSHAECVRLCALDDACGGANWIESGHCYHHPPSNADGSAVSVTPRGDADAYVKIGSSKLYGALQSIST